MLSEKKKMELFIQLKELKKAAAEAKAAFEAVEAAVKKQMVEVQLLDKDGNTYTEKQLVIHGKRMAWITKTKDSFKLDESSLKTQAPDIWAKFQKEVKGAERFYLDKN